MRTLAVLAVLLLAGIGLAKLTAPAARQVTVPTPVETIEPSKANSATFELLLSGTAKRISLEAGGDPLTFENTAGPHTGKLALSSEKPTIFLKVEWAEKATAGHRFAKLRLEIPGQETREHVFSAPGEIDDLWEP